MSGRNTTPGNIDSRYCRRRIGQKRFLYLLGNFHVARDSGCFKKSRFFLAPFELFGFNFLHNGDCLSKLTRKACQQFDVGFGAGHAGDEGLLLVGVGRQEVSLNNVNWYPSVNITSDGTYMVYMRVMDLAGNTASSSRTVRLDAIPPTATLTYPPADGLAGWYVNPVTIRPSFS